MIAHVRNRRLSIAAAACVYAVLMASAPVHAETKALTKVSPKLMADAEDGIVPSLFLVLHEQADLSSAAAIPDKSARGQFVFEQLREVAARTQPAAIAAIREQGLEAIPFYIVNQILIEAPRNSAISPSQILALAARGDVARLFAVERSEPPVMVASTMQRGMSASDIEPNIAQTGAGFLHARGIDGRGIVVGISDSGQDWTHPALASRYRGRSESGASHDYNWFDPSEEPSSVPVDTNGHGTHVAGVAVGGAPGDRIGMAPGARWIGCRSLGPGSNAATVLACLQFFLAPTDLAGKNPDPARAPDVTNHSLACPFCELQDAFTALKAAGIAVVAAAANFGPTCESVFDPATYPNVLAVGSVDRDGAISDFSSRGPVEGIAVKPEIVAPGAAIRSATPGNSYEVKSGTSHASPHVAGAIALLWNARPDLRNDLAATEQALLGAALRTSTMDCALQATAINNIYGYGELNLRPFVPASVRRRAVRK